MFARAATLKPRLAVLSLAIAVLAAMGLSLPWTWLDTAEHLSVDLRYQWRGASAIPAASVIVGVADSSLMIAERAPRETAQDPVLQAMAQPWPWDRSVFARTVRQLRASGARLIVFDIVFAAQTAGDREFATALAEPGAPVVLASLWQAARSAVGESTVTLLEPREELLDANGDRTGYANVWPDPDGIQRRLTLRVQPGTMLDGAVTPEENGLPSLALAAACALQPVMAAHPGYIDYRYLTGSLPIVPIEDLFLPDRWSGSLLRHGQLFRDRIVWVGPMSEIQFKDYHATPFGRMAGVEIQAQMLESILHDTTLRSLPPAAARAWVWVLALAGVLVTWVWRRVSLQVVTLLTGAVIWGILAMVMFSRADLILPVVAPLAAWFAAGGGGLSVRFIGEQRERLRLRRVLGRYVSEEVAAVIADQPESFTHAQRGERREVAVLFADLQGFTSWVEAAEPEALVAQLNEYFHAVVDCVLAHGGTLQKFIGDAVLAVWGDTRTRGPAEDAAAAVNAALDMRASVKRLNADWAGRPDRHPMRIGIGLHTGLAMVGNVGHPRRMEFTVLGDAVNVAARLESANRQLGTTLLASESICRQVNAHIRCLSIGPAVFKGKREATSVFVPDGPADTPAPPWWAQAEAAQLAWQHGGFATAAILYTQLAALASAHAAFFHYRATTAQRFCSAPPSNWDGTWHFADK